MEALKNQWSNPNISNIFYRDDEPEAKFGTPLNSKYLIINNPFLDQDEVDIELEKPKKTIKNNVFLESQVFSQEELKQEDGKIFV